MGFVYVAEGPGVQETGCGLVAGERREKREEKGTRWKRTAEKQR